MNMETILENNNFELRQCLDHLGEASEAMGHVDPHPSEKPRFEMACNLIREAQAAIENLLSIDDPF
jgi:hypothetical protein